MSPFTVIPFPYCSCGRPATVRHPRLDWFPGLEHPPICKECWARALGLSPVERIEAPLSMGWEERLATVRSITEARGEPGRKP